MSNHAHFLFRSGTGGISKVMRRLLTGYAVWFNRKYRRHGQLFQNRYKSIICQQDLYFKELVGGGLVRSLGGWAAVKKLRLKGQDRVKGDERILGDGDLAKRLGKSQPAVSYAVRQGEKIAKKYKYQLLE
jgi:hypothetical protein